jgi:type II secretory pathway component PulF
VLRSLARQVDLVQRLRHRLARLAWYPLLVTSAAWCVSWGITLFVAPRLERFFATTSPLGLDLSALARAYYDLARMAVASPVAFSLAWMGLPVTTWLVVRRPACRRLLSVLPAVRQVFEKLDLAALWSAFAQLQAAGVRPVEIFSELAGAASEPEHARRLRVVKARLEEGSVSLAVAVAQAGFPHFVSAEIAAGESGLNLRTAIDRLVERLQRDIDRHCDQIERLMTATTYALVSLVVVMTASMAILPQLTAAFSRL